MGLLTLDLVPGLCVGAFELGMPLAKAVEHARANKRDYRCVELKYADQEPLAHDIILNFPEHGLHLRFEPRSQRLRLIEVYDASRMQLRCGKGLLGGATHAATAQLVYELLGPTAPGVFDAAARLYPLHYPGLLCLFPIPPQHAAHCEAHAAELPLEFPDNTTPVASRICVYSGAAGSPEEVARARPPAPPRGCCLGEPVQAVCGEGLRFSGGGRALRFGDSPQDVCSQLGSPSSTAAKPARADAATGPPGRRRAARPADYFYRYADRGVDVLFDGRSHTAKKFVLHSNAPGHADFTAQAKCPFRLLLRPPAEPQAEPQAGPPAEDGGRSDWGQPGAGSEGLGSPRRASSHGSGPAQSAAGGASQAPAGTEQQRSGAEQASADGKGLSLQGFLEDLGMSPTDSAAQPPQPQHGEEGETAWDWGGDWTRNLLDIGSEAFALSPRRSEAPGPAASPGGGGREQTPAGSSSGPPQYSPRFDMRPPAEEPQADGGADEGDGWEADLDEAMLGMDLEAAGPPSEPGEQTPAVPPEPPTAAAAAPLPAAGDDSAGSSRSGGREAAGAPQPSGRAGDSCGSQQSEQLPQLDCVCADSRLEDIRRLLGEAAPAAVGGRGLGPHPFGRTRVHGYPGVAFEVMRNGHIASATLFQPVA